jgi:hypothetical protein
MKIRNLNALPSQAGMGKTTPKLAVLIALTGACLLPALPASAQSKQQRLSSREVWPGRRLVMLLPLQLSDNWNADPQFGQSLLRPAEFSLRRALENTGKFSVVQPYRFDPVFQRAVTEKRITKDQLDALVDTPTVQTASGVLANLGFELAPVIADFRIEEVRASGTEKNPAIQVQVLGKLYDLNSAAATQTKVFTSDPIKQRGSQFDTVIEAAANAFQMVANDFVKPPAEVELPRVAPPPTPPAKAKPAKPAKNQKGGKSTDSGKSEAPAATTPPATTPPAGGAASGSASQKSENPAPNASGTAPATGGSAKAQDAAAEKSDGKLVFENPPHRVNLDRNP